MVQFQFILYSPFSQITNLPQRALQSVHIDIPVPGPHIGSGKTPKQPFTGKKRQETFRRATEEDSSPGWTEGQIRVKTHSLNMTECMNSW